MPRRHHDLVRVELSRPQPPPSYDYDASIGAEASRQSSLVPGQASVCNASIDRSGVPKDNYRVLVLSYAPENL